MDQRLRLIPVQLLVQLVEMYLHDIAPGVKIDVPQIIQYLQPGHYLVGMAQQEFQ